MEGGVTIYADGGCRGNGKEGNVGGYGVVLQYKGTTKTLNSAEFNTTNNIQELKSVIEALNVLKTTNIPVKIYSDSAYVINGITSWVKGWKRKGWRKSDGKVVENLELWQRLDHLVSLQNDIEFIKVKGHSNNRGNDLADKQANLAMDKLERSVGR